MEKITVGVVDKNDNRRAKEGEVTDESGTKESSTKEIKKGDVVRLSDG